MTYPGTTLRPQEAVTVLRRWGIDSSPEDVAPGSGTANASAVIHAAGGKLMLRRRNPRYARISWVRFDHALLRHLAADGLPVPRGVEGTLGQAWLREGDGVYELFEFIEGDQHRRGNLDELCAAGEALARVHRSAMSFDPPVEKPWPRFHDPKDLPGWLEPLAQEATGEDAVVLEQTLGLAQQLVERLPDEAYSGLPQTVVQGDYHPANLKFRDGEVAGIFDWDWASRQPRMVDVADGLLFFCGERQTPLVAGDIWSLTEAFAIDLLRVERFLAAYQAVGGLSTQERRALPDLMRCRWLYCRADAARRKVDPERRVEFLTRDLMVPISGIDAIESKLRGV